MFDKECIFDDSTQHLTTEASTDLIDLNSIHNIAVGSSMSILALVTTAMTDSSSNSTMTVTLETDDNAAFSSATEIQTIGLFAALSAIGTKLQVPLTLNDTYERYIRLKYTVANGDLTTGSFFTAIQLTPDASKIYPDAL
tara:strand:- start:1142 stop:1561 length:420 start_codon:yes stop_codon:yes gene_type:complete